MMHDADAVQERLVRSLRNGVSYPHPVDPVRVVETHISWVFLTGRYAYKVKKPVDLGFLDFSTLAKRRFYCHEELRLNRRTAPDLYLEVVPITGNPDAPMLGGAEDAAFEYAVKMVQFPDGCLFSERLAAGKLGSGHVDALADGIARFHEQVAKASPDSAHGRPETVFAPMAENFEHIADPGNGSTERLTRIRRWTEERFRTLQPLLESRHEDGFVRECHGDLHTDNVALIDDRPTPFDCIEFSENLRWIDVMSEVAFLTMDLEDRGRSDLAAHFLNRYLEHTGDYDGLALLPFYSAYRAMVRAKVASIRLDQADLAGQERTRIEALRHSYVDLAAKIIAPGTPRLFIAHGVSGSGKTWGTQRLLERTGAIRLRSDVERKRLFGMKADASSGGGIYNAEANERTYMHLAGLAARLMREGYTVIVDAACLRQWQRNRLVGVASRLDMPFTILAFEAEADVLRQRVRARSASGRDASEADVSVLERQLARSEPLTEAEHRFAVVIDTSDAAQAEAALDALTMEAAGERRDL